MIETPFWQYWYFHLPNYALSALIWTLVGRFLLGLFVPADWNNFIWRFFVRLTDPVLAAVSFLTPRIVPHFVRLLFAVVWVYVVRVAFLVAMLNAGLGPQAPTGG